MSDGEMDSKLISIPELDESEIAMNIKKPVSKVFFLY